jgi:AcrR family transcriptional regulator
MSDDKITTKQKISAAAKNLFSIHGYSETTIDDIITAAGVTKGAFYHYFKSKDAICGEIIDSMQNEYQSLFEMLPKETNPLEKLKALIKRLLELNDSGQWVNCKFLLRLSCQEQTLQTAVKQKLDTFWKWYTEQYRLLITQCRERKQISDKLSAQQQIDVIINILIGNAWTKAVFDSSLAPEIIDHIIERL